MHVPNPWKGQMNQCVCPSPDPAALAAGDLSGGCRDDLGCRPALYRSSFRVCCSLLLLSFVVSGIMPSLSTRRPGAPASGRSAELLVVLAPLKSPWRRMGAGGGATTAFFNKRSCGLPAVGVEPTFFLPLAGRGGEGRKRCCWSSSSAARWRFIGSLSLVCRISCASLLPWCGHPGDGDR